MLKIIEGFELVTKSWGLHLLDFVVGGWEIVILVLVTTKKFNSK